MGAMRRAASARRRWRAALLALSLLSGCSLLASSDDEPAAPGTPPGGALGGVPAAWSASPAPAATPASARRPATRIERVRVESLPPGARVVLQLDGFVEPEVSLLVNQRLVIDVPGTDCEPLPRVIEGGGDPLIERVRTGQHAAPENKSRVVIDLKSRADFSVRAEDDRIVVLLSPAAAAPAVAVAEGAGAPAQQVLLGAEPAAPAPPVVVIAAPPAPTPPPGPGMEAAAAAAVADAATPAPAPAPVVEPAASAPPGEVTALAPPERPLEPPATPAEPEPAVQTPAATPLAVVPQPEATRSARRISIDFTETDVRTVIELIASAGGYHVIFTPEVDGVVSISVVDRPWEDALATVLRAKQLREVRHEDVMLVSPVPRGAAAARHATP